MSNIKEKFTSLLSGRSFPSALLTVILIAAVVFVNIIAYTVTTAFGLYLYEKEEDDLSISSAGDGYFADAIAEGKEVSVIFCSYEKEVREHATGSFVLETAKNFAARYPDLINLKFVNAVTKLEEESGEPFDLSVYKTYRDPGSGEEYKFAINPTSVIFEYKVDDGEAIVKHNYRVVTDTSTQVGYAPFYTLDSTGTVTSYNGEEIFASMVRWVLNDSHSTAYVTVGHGETADVSLYNILSCAGYYVKQLNLKRESVPEDAGLVVISNPRNDFERSSDPSVVTEISRLENYVERGGSFFVTVDPYSGALPVLESFVSSFGITVASTDAGRAVVKDSSLAITPDGFTLVANHAEGSAAEAMLSASGAERGVILREVSPVTLLGNAQPVLVSSRSAIAQAGGETVNNAAPFVLAACSELPNDGGKSARLFFLPSVYLTAEDAVVTEGYSNKDFIYSVFGEYFECGDMPYGTRSVLYDTQKLENLTMGEARLYTALIMAVPAVILAVGAVILIRRKNR